MAQSTEERPASDHLTGAVDCDIHPAVPSTRALLPYLDDYWREHVLRRGLERESLEPSSYPVNAPINGRPDWRLPSGPPGSSLAALQSHLLDRLRPSLAICNVIHGAQVLFSEDLSAAFCRAINNWIKAEWLDRDPRLRASIVVPPHSADLAAEEIERLAPDHRFVQVLLLAMTEIAARPPAELADLQGGRGARPADRHPRRQQFPPSAQRRGLAVLLPGRLRLPVTRVRRRAQQPDHRGRVRKIPGAEGRADRIRRHLAAGLALASRQDLARRPRRSPLAGGTADRDRPQPCPPDPAAVRRAADRTAIAHAAGATGVGPDAAVLVRLSALALRRRRRVTVWTACRPDP